MICTQVCDYRASSLNYGCSRPLLGKGRAKKTEKFSKLSFIPFHFNSLGQGDHSSGHPIDPSGGSPLKKSIKACQGRKMKGTELQVQKALAPEGGEVASVRQLVCMAVYLHLISITDFRLACTHQGQTCSFLPMSLNPRRASVPCRENCLRPGRSQEECKNACHSRFLHFGKTSLKIQKGGFYLSH